MAWVFFCLTVGLNTAVAQNPKKKVSPKIAQTTKDSIDVNEEEQAPDTIPVTFYYQGAEEHIFPYGDTSLTDYFHQYDPLRRQKFEGLNLGNTGSPARQIYIDPIRPTGLDWGFHQFDAYRYSVDSLPFYGFGRALTDAYFSFKGQANSVFRAKFARQFQDGFQFSLNYSKVNQVGQFLSQQALVSSLAAGIQYVHPKQRYRFYLTMSANSARVSENGGLVTDTLFFAEAYKRPETQPIWLTQASTHHLRRKYQFFHFYKWGDFRKGNYLELRHKTWYQSGFYKYFDNKQPLDSLYYGDFLTDGRGIRQFFSGHELGSEMALSFLGHLDSTAIEWLPTPGISVVRYQVNQEPTTRNETQVALTGKWDVTFQKIFALSAKARLGLVGNSGDYLLQGRLQLNTRKVGRWTLFADFQSVTPSMLAQKSFVTQQMIWEHNWAKEFVNRVGGQYELPQFDLSLGGHFTLLTNHIYYGLDGLPNQELKTIPLVQLFVNKNIKLRRFYLESDVLFQKVGENLIRRPALYAHEQLYWKGDLFERALRLKMGVDYRFFSAWTPDAYLPVTGQFVWQDTQKMGNMSGFDVFADLKVSTFRFFAKMENLQYYWDKRMFYETAGYPQFKPAFRLGIGWIFRD